MDFSNYYTESQDDATILRNGGIILKGKTRNDRQPVHMILVVDTSGSMEMENKLSSVKKSIQLMLDLLSKEDRLSLVTFADEAKTFLKKTIPTPEERQTILHRIHNIEADGSTNMSAGLLEARALVEPPSLGRKQGILLLTDGHANIGVHKEEGLLEIIQRIQSESPGTTVTTVAYGVDHNTEMLNNLAKAGGGAYNVVSNLEDVATVFGDILGGFISVSAQKVEVEFPPGSEVFTSFRVEKTKTGRTTVYVGDLYSDGEITLLFKMAPSLGPMCVKGTDMATLDTFDSLTDPAILHSIQDVPITLFMAQYRQKVVDLLAILRKNKYESNEALRPDILTLINKIQGDAQIQSHPLTPILLEDLEQALKLTERGHRMTQHETVEMTQHSAYLGMTRGLRTVTSNADPTSTPSHNPTSRMRRRAATPSQEPTNIRATPVTSPFANRLQTQLASVMRSMSSQADEQ
jgi:uncharacterized protein YegL